MLLYTFCVCGVVAISADGVVEADAELSAAMFSADEVLSECGVSLHVDVLDADRFSKEMFLGQVTLPLQTLPLNTPATKWYPLNRRTVKDKVSD